MQKLPLFESAENITVEGGPDNKGYSAGKLNVLGRKTATFWQTRFNDYLHKNYPFDAKENKYNFTTDEEEESFTAVSQLLWMQGLAIVMSDTTRTLTAEKVVDLAVNNYEFFESCYDAAVKQNPAFDPEWANYLEKAAQEETRNEDGSLKTQEELDPLASSTPRRTSKK